MPSLLTHFRPNFNRYMDLDAIAVGYMDTERSAFPTVSVRQPAFGERRSSVQSAVILESAAAIRYIGVR